MPHVLHKFLVTLTQHGLFLRPDEAAAVKEKSR